MRFQTPVPATSLREVLVDEAKEIVVVAHPTLEALLLEQGTISLNHEDDGIVFSTGAELGEHLGEVDAGFGELGEPATSGDDDTGDGGLWDSALRGGRGVDTHHVSGEWLKPWGFAEMNVVVYFLQAYQKMGSGWVEMTFSWGRDWRRRPGI